MKLAELKEHATKHKGQPEIPPMELEGEKFHEHVRELYQEIRPRPIEAKAGEQWDREVAALINSGECRIAGVTIRRV